MSLSKTNRGESKNENYLCEGTSGDRQDTFRFYGEKVTKGAFRELVRDAPLGLSEYTKKSRKKRLFLYQSFKEKA